MTGCATVTNGQVCGHSKYQHEDADPRLCMAGWLISDYLNNVCMCPGYTDPKENQ